MAEPQKRCVVTGFLLLLMLLECTARRHNLTLTSETRFLVQLNTFGFYANGTLDVNLTSLSFSDQQVSYPVGFSLSRSRVSGVLPVKTEDTETCPLNATVSANNEPLILFLLNVNTPSVTVNALGVQDNILTVKTVEAEQKKTRDVIHTTHTNKPGDTSNQVKKEGNGEQTEVTKPDMEPKNTEESVELGKKNQLTCVLGKTNNSYSFSFHLKVGLLSQGLYSLNFHYCSTRRPGLPYSLSVEVTEKNPGGFLSAEEIPLSQLYIGMAGVFFTAAMVWVYTLMKHRYSVFKIHWLMAALAFTKSTSLVFHSINYHFINTEGLPNEGWAVMYYITHLLKGALLFITLALIGTGWAFVKYILSDKEKKIFIIVIPLQVLANVAYIIIESTEEGSSEYSLWKQILFLVDLICCGAILFPVVWSIRHLQEASGTDGKAAVNLEKLKLFRHYYVMIVCYIYFTRIIAILLKITMPFQWQWCYEFLVEVSTLIFFVLTGYNFRPASNNPYLQLPQDEDDVEMDEVVTESGALQGISKVKKTFNGRDQQKESTL